MDDLAHILQSGGGRTAHKWPDHLLTFMLEINVDIGRFLAFPGDKTGQTAAHVWPDRPRIQGSNTPPNCAAAPWHRIGGSTFLRRNHFVLDGEEISRQILVSINAIHASPAPEHFLASH
jgi:hypothetical protein